MVCPKTTNPPPPPTPILTAQLARVEVAAEAAGLEFFPPASGTLGTTKLVFQLWRNNTAELDFDFSPLSIFMYRIGCYMQPLGSDTRQCKIFFFLFFLFFSSDLMVYFPHKSSFSLETDECTYHDNIYIFPKRYFFLSEFMISVAEMLPWALFNAHLIKGIKGIRCFSP